MHLSSKKSQAAVEFTILFAVSLGMLTGFMAFSRGQFDTINERQIEIDADAFANDMTSYAVFSLRTPHLKVKNFRIPIDIGGRAYTASLAQDIDQTYLIINLTDTGREFFYPLKKKVMGKIDKSSSYAHCITAKEDYAYIAPAIIGLEPGRIWKGSKWEDINETHFNGKMLTVEGGDKFTLYLMGNCVHDLSEIVVHVEYESILVELTKLTESTGEHEVLLVEDVLVSPYGNTFFSSDAKANLSFDIGYGTDEIHITHVSPKIGPVGSDKLIELVFETQEFSSGMATIEISFVNLVDDLIRGEDPLGDSIEILII